MFLAQYSTNLGPMTELRKRVACKNPCLVYCICTQKCWYSDQKMRPQPPRRCFFMLDVTYTRREAVGMPPIGPIFGDAVCFPTERKKPPTLIIGFLFR